ncbi:MAG: hypothetical protein F6K22_25820 [Okeania sp. SIO2F4]|uniref:phthiocerol/phthiodiolone dimycocerosyl transferase family protein n=1 Tax=Okeania sp. SIO2F4 TaxID=2607790 RepID=UPI00142C549C|nr:hypothetical protein [Okeania sp. SIO2F4]NES05924.1 hypothetical protein [Okeania sp. SIO2F4]
MTNITNNRPLFSIEKGWEVVQREVNTLHIVVIGKITGFLDPEVLRRSLLLVQRRHPRLNSHIVGPLDNLMFKTEGTEKIPLEIVLNPEPEYWLTIVSNELNGKFESRKVLIKAILLKPSEESTTNYLITKVHHSVADGICAVHLHSEILNFYQKIVSNSQISQVIQLAPPPCMEEIISDYTIKNNAELSKSNQPIDTIPIEKYVPHQERTCGFIQKQLNPSLTQQLIQRCKQEKLTVQGAISSAMMLALAKNLEPKDRDFYFSCFFPVEMRRKVNYPVGDEQMGILISALTCFYTVNQKMPFWELAKQATEQIKERIKTPEIYNSVFSFCQALEDYLDHPEKTTHSILISNIGKVKIPSEYGDLKLEEISFAPAITIFGNIFDVNVSTFQEKMFFNFVYSKPLVSDAFMEKLIEESIENIVVSFH